MNLFARNGNVHGVARAQLEHLEHHLCTRLSPHLRARVRGSESLGRHSVYGNDLVPADYAVPLSRRSFVRFVDYYVALHVRLEDYSAYASIGVADHHFKVLVVLCRDIDCVRIQN